MNCKNCCFALYYSRSLDFMRRHSTRSKNRKIVLMLAGLDNAGKSCTVKQLAQGHQSWVALIFNCCINAGIVRTPRLWKKNYYKPVNTVVPTVGFSSIKLKHRGYTVVMYDLGGSAQIRGIWSRYFADVHGVIFVVDASDLSRIDESRKVLEELLADEKLTGKPLLLLANKQDREGALDEIDIVERLGLEALVNQQKCPTLVETCSAAGPPNRAQARMDPGIQNGYRWVLRRIISDYDCLNSRVERDSEEQKTAEQNARAEWLSRQETELQLPVDSLPSHHDMNEDPFKPIHTLLASEQNGNASKNVLANGHASKHLIYTMNKGNIDSNSVGATDDDDDRGEAQFIPLHSPQLQRGDIAEPAMIVVSQPLPFSVVTAVREQFEWKMKKQKKIKLQLKKSNRTAPASVDSESDVLRLPPLQVASSCLWAHPRPATAPSLTSGGWGLQMSLEEVDPPCLQSSKTLVVVQSPRTLNSTDSDEDDVVYPS